MTDERSQALDRIAMIGPCEAAHEKRTKTRCT